MFSNGLIPLFDKPTRISTTATLLDNIWTNNYMHPCKSAIFTDPISDHFAVFQCTQLPVSTLRTSNTENIRIFNDNNIHCFQEMLDDVSWHEVYEQNDLDLAFTMFLEKIQINFNEAFPIIIRMKPKSRICGWFDAELRSLQKEKRTAYVRSLRKNNLESQLAYHRIRNHYDRVIKTKKSQYFQKHLASCRNDLKQTCSVINSVIGKKSSISPNCIKGNDRLLTDSFEIAELFNDHFSSIASKLRAKLSSLASLSNLNPNLILLKFLLPFFSRQQPPMKLKKLSQVLNPKTVVAWTNFQPNSYGICHLLRLNYWHTCSINPFLLVNIYRFLELQRLR